MKNPHVWLARVGVVLFLLVLFVPTPALSSGGRGFWLLVAAALCLMYIWKDQALFRESPDPSDAVLLPRVWVPGLVILLAPAMAPLR